MLEPTSCEEAVAASKQVGRDTKPELCYSGTMNALKIVLMQLVAHLVEVGRLIVSDDSGSP